MYCDIRVSSPPKEVDSAKNERRQKPERHHSSQGILNALLFCCCFFYTSLPFRSLQLVNLSVIQFSFRSLYRVSGSINQVDY